MQKYLRQERLLGVLPIEFISFFEQLVYKVAPYEA